MKFKYGKTSLERLNTCHPTLQKLCNELIKYRDISILCGFRNENDQNLAFFNHKSKLLFPNSKHNSAPSLAVDIGPYHNEPPHIHYEDKEEFLEFAGFVRGLAATLGIDLRWGGDWDSDLDTKDQPFNDWVHWEVK